MLFSSKESVYKDSQYRFQYWTKIFIIRFTLLFFRPRTSRLNEKEKTTHTRKRSETTYSSYSLKKNLRHRFQHRTTTEWKRESNTYTNSIWDDVFKLISKTYVIWFETRNSSYSSHKESQHRFQYRTKLLIIWLALLFFRPRTSRLNKRERTTHTRIRSETRYSDYLSNRHLTHRF